MIIDVIKYKGHGSFTEHFSGFDFIKPINVIIGRNNSGKSHLIDMVEHMCADKSHSNDWAISATARLTEKVLKNLFRENHTSNDLPGDHWYQNGKILIGEQIEWQSPGKVRVSHYDQNSQLAGRAPQFRDALEKRLQRCPEFASTKLHSAWFSRLRAERDIAPERKSTAVKLGENGANATNIIRRCLRSTSAPFSPELIRTKLLSGMQQIFCDDAAFVEIEVKEHDNVQSVEEILLEIYLTEEGKGSVPLSRSGSGIKTVILVLLHLLVMPVLESIDLARAVFAFEELENNLHPSVLRRLLRYLEDFAIKHGSKVFLTTHSSVALDVFGASPNAQIVRVVHDRKSARTETVSDYFSHHHIISDLGTKPSDVLQANGVIWVEGPSDRIYVNHWIKVFSNGEVREGRDYQCAFFGGSLLAQVKFTTPEPEPENLNNLLRLNPNVFLLCDSDQTSKTGKGSELKARVKRVISEVEAIPNAQYWITDCKEVENYIPGEVLGTVFGKGSLSNPGQFERFFPEAARRQNSYIEKNLNRKSVDKVELALECVEHMTLENMSKRFDWESRMQSLIDCIRVWNR